MASGSHAETAATSGRRLKDNPGITPADRWYRAPFFGEHDMFWSRTVNFDPNQTCSDDPVLIREEVWDSRENLVRPDSVIRFGIERGDYPYSFPYFEYCVRSLPSIELWAKHVLEQPDFVKRLESAGILHAIRSSLEMRVDRDLGWIDTAISRWSCDSHTFVTSWGEISPTLEDVFSIMQLGIYGECIYHPGMDADLTAEDKAIVSSLSYALGEGSRMPSRFKNGEEVPADPVKNGKNTFSGWVRYWFKDLSLRYKMKKWGTVDPFHGYDGPGFADPLRFHHLAAFIALWLARFIVPCRPSDGINSTLFPLAAILGSGKRLALAPLFLGTLYGQLDGVKAGMEKSLGRFDLSTHLCTPFLQMFFYERFPSAAPMPKRFSRENGQSPASRCARWALGKCVEPLSAVLDIEERFVARPYIAGADDDGVYCLGAYAPKDVMVHGSRVRSWTEDQIFLALITMPGLLPVVTNNGGFTVANYCPDRVARQFGYDQGVSCLPPINHEMRVELAYNRFLVRKRHLALGKLGSLILPSCQRVGMATRQWAKHWDKNLASFQQYIRGMSHHIQMEDVLEEDKSMCPHKEKARDLARWGAPCRGWKVLEWQLRDFKDPLDRVKASRPSVDRVLLIRRLPTPGTKRPKRVLDLLVPTPEKKRKSKTPYDTMAKNRSKVSVVPSLKNESDAIVEQPAASTRQIVQIKVPASRQRRAVTQSERVEQGTSSSSDLDVGTGIDPVLTLQVGETGKSKTTSLSSIVECDLSPTDPTLSSHVPMSTRVSVPSPTFQFVPDREKGLMFSDAAEEPAVAGGEESGNNEGEDELSEGSEAYGDGGSEAARSGKESDGHVDPLIEDPTPSIDPMIVGKTKGVVGSLMPAEGSITTSSLPVDNPLSVAGFEVIRRFGLVITKHQSGKVEISDGSKVIELDPDVILHSVSVESQAIHRDVFDRWPETYLGLHYVTPLFASLLLNGLEGLYSKLIENKIGSTSRVELKNILAIIEDCQTFRCRVDWAHARVTRLSSLHKHAKDLDDINAEIKELNERLDVLKLRKEELMVDLDEFTEDNAILLGLPIGKGLLARAGNGNTPTL